MQGLADRVPLLDSGRHNVGSEASLQPGNVLQTLLFLKGDDDIATLVTVALDAEVLVPLVAGDIVRARAVISWGVGGHQHVAEVDIVRGTMVSVEASFLKVDAANESLPALTGPPLHVGATVGYFPRGTAHRPTRTRFDDNGILTAATEDFTVPSFSATVTYLRAPSAAPYAMRFLDSNGNTIAEFTVAGGADAPINLPLPNDARTVRIVNGAVGITQSRAVFGLAL